MMLTVPKVAMDDYWERQLMAQRRQNRGWNPRVLVMFSGTGSIENVVFPAVQGVLIGVNVQRKADEKK